MHNAKYKTGGLAAAASAIGKVFIFTIKEPQERSGLFAIARSPSGSLTTKMVRFRHEVIHPDFLHNENPSKRLRIIRHPTTLSVAFPLCESSSQVLWRHPFRRWSVQVLPSSKTCQKGFGHLLTAVLHGFCITKLHFSSRSKHPDFIIT